MPEVNGIHYHGWADPDVISILEQLRHDQERGNGQRIRLHYGDRITGQDWMETDRMTGCVGYSTGPRALPLLIHNTRSSGTPILSELIVKIAPASTGEDPGHYWQHADYHLDFDKAQKRLAEIGDREFMRYFGYDQLQLVRFRTTLLRIANPPTLT